MSATRRRTSSCWARTAACWPRRSGPTASHHALGLRGAARVLRVSRTRRRPPGAARSHLERRPRSSLWCAPRARIRRPDIRRLRRALATVGLARRVEIRNDADAALRAGSPDGWGVVLVCGAGVNCLGVAPDGRAARLPALGPISGDRGGGLDVGEAGLAAAIRARDRRGPRTALETLIPAALGFGRPLDVALAVHGGRLPEGRLADLAPIVFEAATSGDGVARGIVDGLADELAGMALAAMRRLGIVRQAVPVILAGGVFRTRDAAFHARLRAAILEAAPRARIEPLDVPPVVGAALLGLDLRARQAGEGGRAGRVAEQLGIAAASGALLGRRSCADSSEDSVRLATIRRCHSSCSSWCSPRCSWAGDARRAALGAAIGGLLVALPLTSGPVAFFLAFDQGPAFASRAIMGSLGGLIAISAFTVAYAAGSRFGAVAGWPPPRRVRAHRPRDPAAPRRVGLAPVRHGACGRVAGAPRAAAGGGPR